MHIFRDAFSCLNNCQKRNKMPQNNTGKTVIDSRKKELDSHIKKIRTRINSEYRRSMSELRTVLYPGKRRERLCFGSGGNIPQVCRQREGSSCRSRCSLPPGTHKHRFHSRGSFAFWRRRCAERSFAVFRAAAAFGREGNGHRIRPSRVRGGSQADDRGCLTLRLVRFLAVK